MSEASDERGLTRRGYKREDAKVWRPEEPPANTAPEWRPDRADLAEWGVTAEEARAMLRRQMCPACGRGPWKSPLTHASKAHGIDRYTMREACGLNTTESLADPEWRETLAERGREHGRDMKALASQPRKKYRHTSAGIAAITANLTSENAKRARATPEAHERIAASIKAMWDEMPDEEKAARLTKLHEARRAPKRDQ